MLRILNIEELERVLMQMPGIIRMFEKQEPQFFESVMGLLKQLEKVLENNRMQACSDIAILRGTLVSVERGQIPEGITFLHSKTHRKLMNAAAIDSLKKANELVTSLIKAPVSQINEAERLIRQILAMAERKGLLITDGIIPDHADFLKDTWKRISDDPELGAVCLHIKGLINSNDILILLDRIIQTGQ
jgi:hypothetical protein